MGDKPVSASELKAAPKSLDSDYGITPKLAEEHRSQIDSMLADSAARVSQLPQKAAPTQENANSAIADALGLSESSPQFDVPSCCMILTLKTDKIPRDQVFPDTFVESAKVNARPTLAEFNRLTGGMNFQPTNPKQVAVYLTQAANDDTGKQERVWAVVGPNAAAFNQADAQRLWNQYSKQARQ